MFILIIFQWILKIGYSLHRENDENPLELEVPGTADKPRACRAYEVIHLLHALRGTKRSGIVEGRIRSTEFDSSLFQIISHIYSS